MFWQVVWGLLCTPLLVSVSRPHCGSLLLIGGLLWDIGVFGLHCWVLVHFTGAVRVLVTVTRGWTDPYSGTSSPVDLASSGQAHAAQ